MGTLTAAIQGKIVFFDTPPLIYYIEQHPVFQAAAAELFDAMDRGMAQGATSILTLAEVLTQPLRQGRTDVARLYRSVLMDAVGIRLHLLDEVTAESAATLRGRYRWLRMPDALQLASALQHGADMVVTNDERWRQLREIPVLVLSDFTGARP